MTVLSGLEASYRHSQNGMIKSDMVAASAVANTLKEVIIFRSTGPWAKRWIERKYPTKNFHVKGKSSNWGPQAGLVPYDGKFSKVGSDANKAASGTRKNIDGIGSGFTVKIPLVMTEALIREQLNRPEGKSKRTALESIFNVPNKRDLILTAIRPGDSAKFAFLAAYQEASSDYLISVFPEGHSNPYRIADNQNILTNAQVLEVMASNEVGARLPMTGDYDLLAVCPSYANYGCRTSRNIVKPAIRLNGREETGRVEYRFGTGLDKVRDPLLHTQSSAHPFNRMKMSDRGKFIHELSQNCEVKFEERNEHPDMGNLTPRILRCINALNAQMGAKNDSTNAPFRRVHHNAESHRHANFGAINRADMEGAMDGDGFGDGFPFTVFQPSELARQPAMRPFGEICTLETYADFSRYVGELKLAGYYVPKNWTWGL